MTIKERFYGFLEYVIALMFIRGGVATFFFGAEPPALPGIFNYLVGDVAIYIYALSWIVMGLLLVYSKWYKKTKTHEWTLFAMYITCVYVLVLSVAINGFVLGQLLALVVGIVAALLWLRWKIKHKYVEFV